MMDTPVFDELWQELADRAMCRAAGSDVLWETVQRLDKLEYGDDVS